MGWKGAWKRAPFFLFLGVIIMHEILMNWLLLDLWGFEVLKWVGIGVTLGIPYVLVMKFILKQIKHSANEELK